MGDWLDGRPHSWSTQDVDPRSALAYWVETVCDRFLELDIQAAPRQRFSARLDQVSLGSTTLSFLDASSQRVRRTATRIARTRHPGFILLQLRTGQLALRQHNREVHLRSGECVLINGSEPYDLECPQFTSAAALRMPEDWLRHWLPRPQDCTARLICGSDWGAALCAAVGSLRRETCFQLALPPAMVGEQIAALLALAVGSQAAPGSQGLLAGLTQTLLERLDDPDLSPTAVASAHGISKRTLHYAFAAGQTTFAERLMQLRLSRAREMLRDPAAAELAIEDVAARCGFGDPSHFARRFRQQFGQPPLQFRRAALRAHH
jgi:AraC-like DNA-binding protein